MNLKYLLHVCILLILLTACAETEPAAVDSSSTESAVASEEAHDEEAHDEEAHDEEDDRHEHENERRELGAHEHGAAELMIAWSGSDVAIDLETPAYNVLGFEYTPTTDEEIALLDESIAALEVGDLLLLSADARCEVESATVHTSMTEDAHHEEEHSPVEHACKHLEEGPEVPVTASADIANTVAVTGTHVRLDVTLADAEGYFVYTAEEAGEYIFYANSTVELTVQQSDGDVVQPESTIAADELADCPDLVVAFTFDLAAGDNLLAISGADTDAESNLVNLVVEHASGDHEHGEHEEGHDDHEDHDDEVHSDIDISYNLTCETPENIASLDASNLFAQFPNFEGIQVQWISDTQQSAGELSPENPMIELE